MDESKKCPFKVGDVIRLKPCINHGEEDFSLDDKFIVIGVDIGYPHLYDIETGHVSFLSPDPRRVDYWGRFELVDNQETTIPKETQCTCLSRDLFHKGCQCGYLKKG